MNADLQRVEITSASTLWDWLEINHGQEQSIWLVTWKASHRDKYVSRDEVLDALIAYGWIDGRRMKLDDQRTMQLLSPRKQQNWAQTYKTRAEKLEREGRMLEPGRQAIQVSKSLGKWSELEHVDALEEPEDLVTGLTNQNAKPWWDNAAPSYRRNILRFIASAKKPETRAKRIAIVSEHAARGEKVPNY